MKSNKKKQGIELRVNILCLLFCFLLSVSMTFCDLLEFLSQASKFLQMTSFDFVFFFFIFSFFWEEGDIKMCKNKYLPLFLTEVGYRKQIEQISGE